jgi:CBS domain containing-hemolysin-like protein
VPIEPAVSVTVGGLLQERLQRIPAVGDEVVWSGFRFLVIEADEGTPMKVELEALPAGGPLP